MEGPRNTIYSLVFTNLVHTLSRRSRITGSTALWYMQKLYGGTNYQYIETIVDENTYIRNLDLITDQSDFLPLLSLLQKYGEFSIVDTKRTDNHTMFAFQLTYVIGDLPINIIVHRVRSYADCRRWTIPFASKNFVLYRTNLDNPTLMFDTIRPSFVVEQRYHRHTIIRNLELVGNYLYNKCTDSGDEIVPKVKCKDLSPKNQMTSLLHLHQDILLIDLPKVKKSIDQFFQMPITVSEKNEINERIHTEDCSICLEPLRNQPVYITKCKHVFHTPCYAKHQLTYYTSVYDNFLTGKDDDEPLTEKCPLCREVLSNVCPLSDCLTKYEYNRTIFT